MRKNAPKAQPHPAYAPAQGRREGGREEERDDYIRKNRRRVIGLQQGESTFLGNQK